MVCAVFIMDITQVIARAGFAAKSKIVSHLPFTLEYLSKVIVALLQGPKNHQCFDCMLCSIQGNKQHPPPH